LKAKKKGVISGSFSGLPGIITRKSIIFLVTEPGNQMTSGYRAPEIGTKKTLFRGYLREDENIFVNILGYCSGELVLLIHEKNRGQKSHATVPLNKYRPHNIGHDLNLVYIKDCHAPCVPCRG
jgi:hypothetical protein